MDVKTELQPRRNIYKVYCDGELFCWTENDDDGLKLQIAVAKLNLIRSKDNDKLFDTRQVLASSG